MVVLVCELAFNTLKEFIHVLSFTLHSMSLPSNQDAMSMESLEKSLDNIRESMSSAREVVKSLNERYVYSVHWLRSGLTQNSSVQKGELDTKEGISLLSLKNTVMVQYLQSLVLLSAHRALGHSLSDRTPPSKPWGAADRDPRGSGAGDQVDAMIEERVVLEKVKLMEGKMKYQIEKLTKLAQEEPESAKDAANGTFSTDYFKGKGIKTHLTC